MVIRNFCDFCFFFPTRLPAIGASFAPKATRKPDSQPLCTNCGKAAARECTNAVRYEVRADFLPVIVSRADLVQACESSNRRLDDCWSERMPRNAEVELRACVFQYPRATSRVMQRYAFGICGKAKRFFASWMQLRTNWVLLNGPCSWSDSAKEGRPLLKVPVMRGTSVGH